MLNSQILPMPHRQCSFASPADLTTNLALFFFQVLFFLHILLARSSSNEYMFYLRLIRPAIDLNETRVQYSVVANK